ncbi:hypothetical protein SteCoe_8975 [Stentor coeruleus]|uniref:Major facilitator superfamily (MFS) profile domain-containing protein n=1 Tax=Stentor coeruleus TaxID=5963 RepID=A0A1R2CJ40_9CILI|nr:hypothetical protein SteCoe_8975 [Stentor coeruleus]
MSNKEFSEITPLKTSGKSELHMFLQSFSELSRSRIDLFYLFAVGAVETLGICIITTGLSIYLSTARGLSDLLTGYIIASYGGLAFIYSILFGSLIDKYGLKICLILGNFSALFGYMIIIFNSSISVQVFCIITFISGGNSVVIPTLKLGIKHYANDNAKSLGYSTLYILIFGAGAMAGVLVDVGLSIGSKDLKTFTIIFSIGGCFIVLSTALSFLITDIERSTEAINSWEITKEVFQTKVFLKFMCLTLLLVVIKALYNHMSMTLPLYMHRSIGEDAHFGYMLAIHKGVMVIFIPLLTSMIYFFSCYSLLMIGGFISALSVIPLLFEASYLSVTIFIVIVSIGESLYAPRLIDYALSIAPPGKEGTFISLASSPLALSMIIAGLSGGVLLTEFCPSHGDKHCWAVWGIIGLITLTIPIIMLIFREYLEEKNQTDKNLDSL